MSAHIQGVIVAGSGVFLPILMCEQGARRRSLDLEVAAADARHWWDTGEVPLRATPLDGTTAAIDSVKPNSTEPEHAALDNADSPAGAVDQASETDPDRERRNSEPPAETGPDAEVPDDSAPVPCPKRRPWWRIW